MHAVFLDTSFIIALENADDRHHHKAVRIWEAFGSTSRRIVTTTYVFDETATFLNRHMGHARATAVGEALLSSSIVEVVHVSRGEFEAAWELFRRHRDKGYSFTDCVSFLVMEQLGLTEALTFDDHFRQKGFRTAAGR